MARRKLPPGVPIKSGVLPAQLPSVVSTGTIMSIFYNDKSYPVDTSLDSVIRPDLGKFDYTGYLNQVYPGRNYIGYAGMMSIDHSDPYRFQDHGFVINYNSRMLLGPDAFPPGGSELFFPDEDYYLIEMFPHGSPGIIDIDLYYYDSNNKVTEIKFKEIDVSSTTYVVLPVFGDDTLIAQFWNSAPDPIEFSVFGFEDYNF